MGNAFREGFDSALDAQGDSAWLVEWSWHDNQGIPDSLQTWLDLGEHRTEDLVLGGLGTAASEFEVRPEGPPLLWMGNGYRPSADRVWPIWPTHSQVSARLQEWVRSRPGGVGVLLLADPAWTPPWFENDTLANSVYLFPHDPLVRHWHAEIGEILRARPKTLIFWDRPEHAADLLGMPLLQTALEGRSLLLPPGVDAPEGCTAFRLRSGWPLEPSLDSGSLDLLRSWGHHVGRGVMWVSRCVAQDSTSTWSECLRRRPLDSLLEETSVREGWIPRLEILADEP